MELPVRKVYNSESLALQIGVVLVASRVSMVTLAKRVYNTASLALQIGVVLFALTVSGNSFHGNPSEKSNTESIALQIGVVLFALTVFMELPVRKVYNTESLL